MKTVKILIVFSSLLLDVKNYLVYSTFGPGSKPLTKDPVEKEDNGIEKIYSLFKNHFSHNEGEIELID
tara:strand:+ start:534 stop:737 length:204 start_codon:yes stop_codon:yes gene_type:complete